MNGFGEKLADRCVSVIGSWKFIVAQTALFLVWIIVNTVWALGGMQFDPPPFILFNLIMSAEAAYATPLILMAQNRQAVADHQTLNDDFALDRESERRIEEMQAQLDEILRRLRASQN